MDPKTPHDLSGMAGVPWSGRGRALHPQDAVVGRSRLLSLSTEGPGIGRARGFITPGDTSQGSQGPTLPVTQSVFGRARGLLVQPDDERVGRARGLLLPAAEPQVGAARDAALTGLEAQTPQSETTVQDPTGEATTPAEVWFRNVFFFTFRNRPTTAKKAFVYLQVAISAHGGASALVSMFRGMGIEPSVTSWGRGTLPVGLYREPGFYGTH